MRITLGGAPWSRVAVLGGVVTLTALSVQAQSITDLQNDCRAEAVERLTPQQIGATWERFYPPAVELRLAPALRKDDYATAMAELIGESRDALRLVADTNLANLYAERLDELERQFARLLSRPSASPMRFLADSVRPADFLLSQSTSTGRFAFGDPRVVVTELMSQATRRGLCWPTIAIHHVLSLYGAPARAASVAALDALASRWDNYVSDGYSQLPWELALNSYRYSRRAVARNNYEPPGAQWIVMHPSIGAEANGPNFRELRRIDVAVLEGLGMIWYNGDRTRYWGGSVVATFAADANAAAGAYLHLWFPQAKLGVVWRSDPVPDRRRSVLASVDLYDLFAGIPKNLKQAKEDALNGSFVKAAKLTQ